ncbi:hypothetical protein VNI00_003547 [Paramarasmius palmivorus]|uniref:Cyclohexanone monooxygenase n=1 Tax=Paramarasmius palmivorus TaxID=297713 RepID=A0AAW0DV94_9AGAR
MNSSFSNTELQLDILVIGAGFSGLYQLYNLRKDGYTVKIFESANDIGGTWHFARYPGARLDSPTPMYEFSIEEVWRDWNWTEQYPSSSEIRAYFKHVDAKLDLSKDIYFNTRVISAHWDTSTQRWKVKAQDGKVAHARFLIVAVGPFIAKPYKPAFEGMDSFKGICYHTAEWPQEGVELKGRRVAVIGTAASGVQVIQEAGKEGVAEHLTVFQRTPDITIPMRQRKLDIASQAQAKGLYPVLYRRRTQTFTGVTWDFSPKTFSSMTPEERILALENAYAEGGFRILGVFADMTSNEAANAEVYAFWRAKTIARIQDPQMQEKLAPIVPPYPFVARRLTLEQTFYEVFNQPNVDLVDLKETPIARFTPKGIVTTDGVDREFDVIVLATGYDSLTGAIVQIDIRGIDGTSIADKWKAGVYSHLGMTVANFPNMFYMSGPQTPVAFGNVPACVEVQGNWITSCIKHMTENNLKVIEATREAETSWRNLVLSKVEKTPLKNVRSWQTGANIPGKVVEPLGFLGGIGVYAQMCRENVEKGYEGFKLLVDVHPRL